MALAILSGVLDGLKTIKKDEPPPLTVEVKTLDDAINDLRGIGCNVLESVIMKSEKTPALISDYSEFRSYAYKRAIVYKITTLGETMLYTYDENDQHYSWIAPDQTKLLPPKYSQLIIANTTCKKVNGGWQITMTFKRDGDYGDSLNHVTINGLEITYPNYSANSVLQKNLSTDLVYPGTYIDGAIYKNANIWISDRLDYHSGESILVRIKSLGGYVYNKMVALP